MSNKIIPCRECGKAIVFLQTGLGKAIPVDFDSIDATDVLFDREKHKTHFATCSKPERFRKVGRRLKDVRRRDEPQPSTADLFS